MVEDLEDVWDWISRWFMLVECNRHIHPSYFASDQLGRDKDGYYDLY